MEENEEKLPADSSSVSVEANDAKTGVHCPQLRARGGGEGREGKKERRIIRQGERRRESTLVGRAAHTDSTSVTFVPRKEQG